MADISPNINDKLTLATRTSQLMFRERQIVMSGPLIALYLAYLHFEQASLSNLILWIVLMTISDATTFTIAHRYLKKNVTRDINKWLGAVIVSHSTGAFLWGYSFLLFYNPQELIYTLYNGIVVVGVCSVTCVALVPMKKAYLSFIFSTWALPAIFFVYIGTPEYLNLAAGVVVLVISLIIYQNMGANQHVESVEETILAKSLAEYLQQKNKQLERHAEYDDLTNIYNRRYTLECIDRVKEELNHEEGEQLTLILIDIDHFKNVNDTHGHPVGDRVLVNFAKSIKSLIASTSIFGRVGGEEFLLALPNTGLDIANCIAEDIRTTISQRLILKQPDLSVTLSLGICVVQPNESIKQSITRCDIALYRAKNLGRNRVEIAV